MRGSCDHLIGSDKDPYYSDDRRGQRPKNAPVIDGEHIADST